MIDTKKEQERDELHRAIWAIADELRGAVDGIIVNSCVHNLTWTHFHSLLRVPDEDARVWYMSEASHENWNVRMLDRMERKKIK